MGLPNKKVIVPILVLVWLLTSLFQFKFWEQHNYAVLKEHPELYQLLTAVSLFTGVIGVMTIIMLFQTILFIRMIIKEVLEKEQN